MSRKKIKVLVITSSYPTHPDDLRGTFIGKQVRCISEKGYSMVVLTPHVPRAAFLSDTDNIKIYRFPYFFPFSLQRLSTPGGMFFGFKQSFLGKIQIISYIIMMLIYTGIILKKEHITIIHTHWIVPQGLAGALWKNILGIPHVATSHVLDLTVSDTIPILQPLIKRVLRHTDAITVNSSFTLKQALRFSPPTLKNHIIPMGLDESRIHGINGDNVPKKRKNSILFVGRLMDWKGVDNLIQAVNIAKDTIPDIALSIIGEGPERNKYELLVKSLMLEENVFFKGKISDAELNSAYLASALFVLPSTEKKGIVMEGLGVVLLEAMASGVPVIGSNTGGIPDIITDGVNGLLVPPGNPDALAAAIVTILENPEMADKFTKEGLKTVKERFSWDKISDRFIEVYQRVLNESNEV